MCLIMCDVCDKNITGEAFDGTKHECNPDDIRAYIGRLTEGRKVAEERLEQTQNAVQMVLHGLPAFDAEQVTVRAKWLRQLWDAALGRWWEAEDADTFWMRDHARQSLLCAAFRLFRSKNLATRPAGVRGKLAELRKSCEWAAKACGYGDPKFDLTAEDVVRQAVTHTGA